MFHKLSLKSTSNDIVSLENINIIKYYIKIYIFEAATKQQF